MKLLISNDDGIDAPGLAALERVAAEFGEIVTVAPDRCFSSCGHGVSTHRALHIREVSVGRYSVDGSPADCVRLGLLEIAPDVDWVIAGINQGANLGTDIYLSGTVAAAREAMLLGKKSLAISQYHKSGKTQDWERSARFARVILPELLHLPLGDGEYWNVNLPDVAAEPLPERVICPVDPSPLPVAYRREANGGYLYSGAYHSRQRLPDHDVALCFAGQITISRLRHVFA
jgi:5'-nucleotidase